MAKESATIYKCDVCGQDTQGFSYWEECNSPLGVISESKLVIDICEQCCRNIYHNIPDFMLQERGEDYRPDTGRIEKQINKWRELNR